MPKAVAVPHLGVIRLVCEPNYVRLHNSSRLLQMAPLSFDAATFEIWGALLNGGTLVIMPPGLVSPHDVGEVLTRHQVNTLWLTAGFFDAVVSSALPALAGVRQLLAGGDVLSADHVDQVRRAHPDCQVINGYGPTENTTFTCCFPVPPQAELGASVPIGFPINNTRVYVLDEYLQPVPVGVAGELYAAGLGLARGYLNCPGLTAERFVADPHAKSPGQRMYRTGDLARRRDDGAIEFLGRVDHLRTRSAASASSRAIETSGSQPNQACRRWWSSLATTDRGERLPGGLRRAPRSRRNAGCDRPATTACQGSTRLYGTHRRRDHGGIAAHPQWQARPASLPEPGRPHGTAGSDKHTRPQTLLELEIVRIWQQLFGRDNIGREEHFFDLGGHSLLAARLVAEIERLMHQRLPIAALFQAPTVASLGGIVIGRRMHALAWEFARPHATGGNGPPGLLHPWSGGRRV